MIISEQTVQVAFQEMTLWNSLMHWRCYHFH